MNGYNTDEKVLLVVEIDKAILRLEQHKANMFLRKENNKGMLIDVALALVAEIIKPGEKK